MCGPYFAGLAGRDVSYDLPNGGGPYLRGWRLVLLGVDLMVCPQRLGGVIAQNSGMP